MRTENDVIDSRIEINLVDFLAQLLYRWKLVLSLVIAGIVLLSCLWVIKSRKQRPAEEISVSRIAQAKENMSDEQIEHVDYVYSQYLSYKNYRRSLQDYLSSSLYDSSDFEDNIRKETLYCVESDIENINQCFTRLALGVNEYDAIADILGLDNSLYDDVYRRVAIADVNLQNNGEGGNIVIQESDQKVLTKNILDVYIVAPTIEQADKISEVIEKSFDTLIQKLLEYDGRLQFSEIDHTYKTNIADFIYSRQTNLVNNLNQVNTAIDELETKYVNKMSSDERAYYNQIKERDELIVAPVKRLSLKKYLAIGFLLGLFVAILFVFLRYIFDGSIKTAGELSRIYSLPVLYSVNQSNKGTNFFSAIARR